MEEKAKILEDLLMTLVSTLVDKPEEFTLNTVIAGNTVVLELHCTNREEVGKLIGKEGKNISAVLRLLIVCGMKHKVKVFLNTPKNN